MKICYDSQGSVRYEVMYCSMGYAWYKTDSWPSKNLQRDAFLYVDRQGDTPWGPLRVTNECHVNLVAFKAGCYSSPCRTILLSPVTRAKKVKKA
jgi:hypothetical protein